MKLSFVKKHKSISKLNSIDLGDFAVITGLNGAGKTHLLQAIENGSVKVEEIPTDEIIYYNYNDFNLHYDSTSGKQNAATQRNSPPVVSQNQRMQQKGNAIVQRLTKERNQTLNSFTVLSPLENQLVSHNMELGHTLDQFKWGDEDIEAYHQIPKLDQGYDWEGFAQLPEKVRIVYDILGDLPPNTDQIVRNIQAALPRYNALTFIRRTGYNRQLLEWSDSDLETYRQQTFTGQSIDIHNLEMSFSQNFIEFYWQYEEFSGGVRIDIESLHKEMLVVYQELEDFLVEKLPSSTLQMLKGFASNSSLLVPLYAESGFLDLNQIANEEKRYQVSKNQNDFNRYLNKDRGDKVHYLEDDEFLRVHGKSPVELLNQALEKYDCNGYEFRPTKLPHQFGINPNEHQITISLFSKEKNYQTSIDALSSGERTILALTFYIFKLKYKRRFVASLLLLDEIDSSLHPSMSKRLINVLHELFYNDLGIRVILSTHSPSTVAFAPKDSLYIMRDIGDERILQSSKDLALKELTFGVPSFSINYENRRQVFVESKYDVEYYEKLYQIFKKQLVPEVSLNFIASGDVQKDSNGGPKSSCDQVIEITKLLRGAGNTFIWGIIDWDLKAKTPDCKYVKVLGQEERYNIENFLFDPLLVAILVLREKIKTPADFGLADDFKIYEIKDFQKEQLQQLIDHLLTLLQCEIGGDINDRLIYKTVGGRDLSLPKFFVNYQGHDLENTYLKVFPELNRLKRNDEKALKIEVISKVIEDYPELAPQALLDILQSVQAV